MATNNSTSRQAASAVAPLDSLVKSLERVCAVAARSGRDCPVELRDALRRARKLRRVMRRKQNASQVSDATQAIVRIVEELHSSQFYKRFVAMRHANWENDKVAAHSGRLLAGKTGTGPWQDGGLRLAS